MTWEIMTDDSMKFPVFANHELARCFQCVSWLVSPQESKNASGRGRYFASCEGGCGHLTWYDLCEREEAS